MRKPAISCLMLLTAAILSGCAQIAMGRAEIDKLFITRIISIDESPEGKVKITLTTKSLSTGGGDGQMQQKGESITSEGDTVFNAVRDLMVYSDRKPHFGHTEYILFGEAIARKGILPYLDFISRQNEFRYNAKIYIVKNNTANTLVKKTNTEKMFIGDRISIIEEDASFTSLSSIVTLNEALQIFDNKNLDTFIPYVELIDTMTSEEKQDMYDILLRGYAVFGRDKLFYFTSREEARGLNWMMNRVRSGIIPIKCKQGASLTMEIVDARVKILPRIEGSELQCTIDASFTTNIAEIVGTGVILDSETVKYMIKQQNEAVKKEISMALDASMKDNSDRFGIITKFIMKYPMLKDYLSENWKYLYPEVKFNIKVTSNIKGTYMLNEPVNAAGEVKGE